MTIRDVLRLRLGAQVSIVFTPGKKIYLKTSGTRL